MRNDVKIGIAIGVVVLAIGLIYFVFVAGPSQPEEETPQLPGEAIEYDLDLPEDDEADVTTDHEDEDDLLVEVDAGDEPPL
jgi:hypothetical protein